MEQLAICVSHLSLALHLSPTKNTNFFISKVKKNEMCKGTKTKVSVITIHALLKYKLICKFYFRVKFTRKKKNFSYTSRKAERQQEMISFESKAFLTLPRDFTSHFFLPLFLSLNSLLVQRFLYSSPYSHSWKILHCIASLSLPLSSDRSSIACLRGQVVINTLTFRRPRTKTSPKTNPLFSNSNFSFLLHCIQSTGTTIINKAPDNKLFLAYKNHVGFQGARREKNFLSLFSPTHRHYHGDPRWMLT